MCYLTDDDFVKFLVSCKNNLVDGNSVIFLKDNVSATAHIDENDNSIVRSEQLVKHLIEMAGLAIVK